MTEREKSLLLAKKMYGEDRISPIYKEDGMMTYVFSLGKCFNPYKDGNDSQSVQEFFGIEAAKQNYDGEKEWFCQTPTSNAISHSSDLKTAISDCAIKIIQLVSNQK